MSDPVVIGIAGGSGSGKTSVARKVQSFFPYERVLILSHDSYYRHYPEMSLEERSGLNFDHPSAFETDLLIAHIDELKSGRRIVQPNYDYETHLRQEEGLPMGPGDIVLLEGILVLEDARLRDRMDIRIFIDADADERFIRRLQRDVKSRERDLESIIRQYTATVRPMHLQFVESSKRYADLIIPEGAHNEVAIDLLVTKIHDILNRKNLEQENGE
ncbi:MAG: uridine kinase [Candidatus Krumholzibacteria bacterium]|jgi:uridine kinase|nr:uridine kinase [Candidatus Krumholzibacteria bacterium]MDP6669334.1 uridine kinase [Candidatus Krumholzibacteria bacterium]MDP6796773.1 uridine kinase [Candidatus Krumholzibacteria bacterium]MDP7021673.1 uridine kinase [Candidatus Krumholzibacteria bacterium]